MRNLSKRANQDGGEAGQATEHPWLDEERVARKGGGLFLTWSKSTMRSRPTPERSSMLAAWLPTPPKPTTTCTQTATHVRDEMHNPIPYTRACFGIE
jgi:hypothetical protein